jgi:hypothetical protein
MFFRRQKPGVPAFEDRLAELRHAGFEVDRQAGRKLRLRRGICAAEVEDVPGAAPRVLRAGILAGEGIAAVTHGGYQMFLVTESGQKMPATASHLKNLHAFTEDLKEGLGLGSLYNTSLGTTCEDHHYDRVCGRDRPPEPKPWRKVNA